MSTLKEEILGKLSHQMHINDLPKMEKIPTDELEVLGEGREMMMLYRGAIKEVITKLEILNEAFSVKSQRNPIEYVKSRVKTPLSIVEKLRRQGLEVSVSSAKENLNDIAGIRVVCSFVSDIYFLADMLVRQDDVALIQKKDYIANPKPNGYRSLHIVVEVPVYFCQDKEKVRVEIQIRTIAMDFWASLEHKLHYKKTEKASSKIVDELRECAHIISSVDEQMARIHSELEKL